MPELVCSICGGNERVMEKPASKLRTYLLNNILQYKGGSVCYGCYAEAQKRHRMRHNRQNLDDTLDRIVMQKTPLSMKPPEQRSQTSQNKDSSSFSSGECGEASTLTQQPAAELPERSQDVQPDAQERTAAENSPIRPPSDLSSSSSSSSSSSDSPIRRRRPAEEAESDTTPEPTPQAAPMPKKRRLRIPADEAQRQWRQDVIRREVDMSSKTSRNNGG